MYHQVAKLFFCCIATKQVQNSSIPCKQRVTNIPGHRTLTPPRNTQTESQSHAHAQNVHMINVKSLKIVLKRPSILAY